MFFTFLNYTNDSKSRKALNIRKWSTWGYDWRFTFYWKTKIFITATGGSYRLHHLNYLSYVVFLFFIVKMSRKQALVIYLLVSTIWRKFWQYNPHNNVLRGFLDRFLKLFFDHERKFKNGRKRLSVSCDCECEAHLSWKFS